MPTATNTDWRLQKPYSSDFYCGYLTGKKWAKHEGKPEEFLRIADVIGTTDSSPHAMMWPFTHDVLDYVNDARLRGYNTTERFYFIIRPSAHGDREVATHFIQEQLTGVRDELLELAAETLSNQDFRNVKKKLFQNMTHVVNGFMFGAFHYWLDQPGQQ